MKNAMVFYAAYLFALSSYAGLDRDGNMIDGTGGEIAGMILTALFFCGIYVFADKVLSWSSSACFYASLISGGILAAFVTMI